MRMLDHRSRSSQSRLPQVLRFIRPGQPLAYGQPQSAGWSRRREVVVRSRTIVVAEVVGVAVLNRDPDTLTEADRIFNVVPVH